MRNWWIWIFFLLPIALRAQEQKGDSLQLPAIHMENRTAPMQGVTFRTDIEEPASRYLTDSSRVGIIPPSPLPLFRGDYFVEGHLFRYRNGALTGFGEQSTIPGIGRINEATILWSQVWGNRLLLQTYVQATQLEMEFLHRHVWGVGGTLHYQLDNHWSLRAFGSYDTGNPYNPYGRQWGGSLVWRASTRFGIEGGVRRRYNAWTHRWETEPIVAPYYQLDQLKLQIDLGPVLHQLFQELFFDHSRRGGPTIAPPKVHR